MNFKKFDNKLVRIITIDDEVFEGYCSHSNIEFNECEFGINAETLDIENFKFKKDDIKKIECIENFTTPYSSLEILTVEDGISFIEDVLESEEPSHVIRLLDYLCSEIDAIDCKEEIIKILDRLSKSDIKEIKSKSKKILKKWS